MLSLLISLIEQAEVKFNDGATRKEWVMAMVQTSAEYINYPVDTQVLSTMIDTLCNMSKVVNATIISTDDSESQEIESAA